ncbi:Lrp/AsnC family transcriptional regulator [Streptomyces globisporus]|uniref:Lrp/AsnC family transcriptional regulator n=1 Tax=Streptomyces TaxID=1883 RepID=UPI000AF7106F|nr:MULTISPECIES: Lrp/AsnC family transcriptional regulator [Streptomyces]
MPENSGFRDITPFSGAAPEKTDLSFSELDLALIDALQSAPRATWTELGRALDIDATTAARRWDRLRAQGLAWITAHETPRTATVAFIDVRCRPEEFDAVSRAVAQLPWVISVEETTGDFELLLTVTSTDLRSLGRAVHSMIGGLRGVLSTRTSLGLTAFGEGGDWRTHTIGSSSRALLQESGARGRHSYSARTRTRETPHGDALRNALGRDGRLGYKELGAAVGISEFAARRRLLRMLRDQEITLRCDLAHPLAGYHAVVLYRAKVSHRLLESTATSLARLEQVRLAVAVSGSHDLLVMVWLRDLDGIAPFESALAERFPLLALADRTVVLHTLKRMGWLLDHHGRATRYIPLALPEEAPA